MMRGRDWIQRAMQIPARLAVGLVRCYQWLLSPLLGKTCRFTPTCSQYMIESVVRHGLIRGGWQGVRRILRCHPFSAGGYDPPK